MKKTILTILFVALLLFGLCFALQGVGEKKAQESHLWLLQTLLPDSTDFVLEPYAGGDETIRSVHRADNGFVIETVTYGYAGEIRMYVGVNLEGRVVGLVVDEAHETLGLGSRALTDHVFLAQFLNSSGSFALATNGEADAFSAATGTAEAADASVTVDGISGATVTTKAVIRCVNAAVGYVTGVDTATAATTWGG